MNRRQMVVIWSGTIILSLTSVLVGMRENDPVYGIVLPVVMIGGALVYQWRDKELGVEDQRPGKSAGRITGALVLLVLVQSAALLQERSAVRDVSYDISEVSSAVSSLEDAVSSLPDEIESRR